MKTKKQKTIDIIVSVLVAIVLWGYVISFQNETHIIKNVPVHLIGEEQMTESKLAIAGSGNYSVDVEISGRREDVANITADDLHAEASLENMGVGQNYINVSVTGPGHINIDDVRSQRIQIYVDDLITATKPVSVVLSDAGEGFEETIISRNTYEANVTGAKSLIDSITNIQATLDAKSLKPGEETTVSVKAIPVGADGNKVAGVKCSVSAVDVTAAIYPTKIVDLVTDIAGTPALNAEVQSIDVPKQIKIKGPQEILDSIEAIYAEPISYDGITQSTVFDLAINLPDKVYFADANTNPNAFVELKDTVTLTYTYTANEIRVIGLAENEKAEITLADGATEVTATIIGNITDLAKLAPSDFAPCIDVSAIEAHEATLALTKPQEITSSVTYDVLEALVRIR